MFACVPVWLSDSSVHPGASDNHTSFTTNKHLGLADMGQKEVERRTAVGKKWLSLKINIPIICGIFCGLHV
jgi:hypothetical protein